MKQKKISKLIDTVASKRFETEKELFEEVLEQIVQNDEINVTGGKSMAS